MMFNEDIVSEHVLYLDYEILDNKIDEKYLKVNNGSLAR